MNAEIQRANIDGGDPTSMKLAHAVPWDLSDDDLLFLRALIRRADEEVGQEG